MAARGKGAATGSRRRRVSRPAVEESDPLWYKDAVIYQLHVRSFRDSDGDGIGDFRGLREKLDYLQELGVTALWLLPFYESPLRDEGYDIAHYGRVHPSYGDLKDFKAFLRAAHQRGLRVITELVINHTSDRHPWFQRARKAPAGSVHRDYYVWSDTAEEYPDARIIFRDFETSNWSWDPVAKAYYWHRFYHHQPDLNFESPRVRKEVLRALDFWLDMGVDGLRLDAIPYLFEREGTNCENLPETHAYLKQLRAHVDERFDERMLLAEANQWPEDAAAYFGDGDECHMNFHFPVMPRLFMGLRMEDRFPIVDILQQTPRIPEVCQWATFLRNHDELTLEMVTDEDRDYMYRMYAKDPQARINLGIRRRLAPLLGNDRRRIELMNALLFSLPGTPIVYYGDEIGMGDNIYLGDRSGVRTPMQWGPGRNAGFSEANPQKLYLPVVIDPEYHYQSVNVEAQQENPHSLLWWTRRLISLRKRYPAFGRGEIEFLSPANHSVLAFLRRHEGQSVLVVANLSRFAQPVELRLSEYADHTPIEMFGHTRFPRLGQEPYPLTLGPHTFLWFELEAPEREAIEIETGGELPDLGAVKELALLWRGRRRGALEAALARTLPGRRWFRAKGRNLQAVEVVDSVPLDGDGESAWLLLVSSQYADTEPELYALVVGFEPETGEEPRRGDDEAAYARLRLGERPGRLVDVAARSASVDALLRLISSRRRASGQQGALRSHGTQTLKRLLSAASVEDELEPRAGQVEQSNTTVFLGHELVLKLYRKLEPGTNPDLEVTRFLTEKTDFRHAPRYYGSLEYEHDGASSALGLLQGFVESEGDAWQYTLNTLGRYFERALARPEGPPERAGTDGFDNVLAMLHAEPAPAVREAAGLYLESVRRLGIQTAELHRALASRPDVADFAPESYGAMQQRSTYQSMRATLGRSFTLLERRLERLGVELGEEVRAQGARALELQDRALAVFERLLESRDLGRRIRNHGDFHLGQVLFTGDEFVILDFEGEPARPLGERRIKRSPLRDVAGMLRSFDYAVAAAERELAARGVVETAGLSRLEGWGRAWAEACLSTYLHGYLGEMGETDLLPRSQERIATVLEALLLEKACYELGYELDNRPQWVSIPLRGILRLLEGETS